MNIKKAMKQLQEMSAQMNTLQEEMAKKEYSGEAGSGSVVVIINGASNLLSVKIAPSMLIPEEKELLEDLIIAAFNNAKEKADNDSKNSMSNKLGGIIPSGMNLPF